jgi:hypothetical protein
VVDTNQKIVVAISIIAIVLSLANLTILLLPKSTNGSIDLSVFTGPQNLYVANVTYTPHYFAGVFDYLYSVSIVNPTKDTHYYCCSLLFIRSNQTYSYTSFPTPSVINPHSTQNFLVTPPLGNLFQRAEVSIFDTSKGFVYDETLNIINTTQP